MLDRFSTHIAHKLHLNKESKLLLGCSGGVDSVVLAHLLADLGYTFALAHCNFALRGTESDEDQAFVDQLADQLQVPFFAECFETEDYAEIHKISVQMAARELRYTWFEELRKDFSYRFILTAHHADDDLETFLINLSRGTGLRGLSGIPEITESLIRPLLPFSREDIVNYAKAKGLYWREDSSNARAYYLRNKLRHEVIPPFKAAGKNILQSFLKTQHNLKGSLDLVEDYMVLIYNLVVVEESEGLKINIQKLKELPHTRALLYELLYPFGFTAWDDIFHLLGGQSGKQVLSATHRVLRDREYLLVTPLPDDMPDRVYSIAEETSKITEPIHLEFDRVEDYEITNANTVFVATDALSFPLELRKWKPGDSFQPFGMRGKKKLSKFFKDEKLSLVAKQNVWVICCGNTIVWVVGMRLDDRFKVEKNTKNITRIVYTPRNL